MLLIGFGHRARQGKNTAALAMLEACPIGADARLFAFADALKKEVDRMIRQTGSAHNCAEMLRDVYGAPDWVVGEYVGKQRPILQWWGTSYRRAKDPDYWVARVFETFKSLSPEIAIVTDVRFPNEVAAIKAAGGIVVKVTRLGAPDIVVNEHPSEAALDGYTDWDYQLAAASIPELRAQTTEMYREIVGL